MGAMPFRLSKGDLLSLDGAFYEWQSGNASGTVLHPVQTNGAQVAMTHQEMKDCYFGHDDQGRELRILRQALPNLTANMQKNMDRAFETFSVKDQDSALMRMDYMTLSRKFFDLKKCPRTPGGFKRISRLCAWLRRRETARIEGVPASAIGLEHYSGETLKVWYRRWRKGGFTLSSLLPENSSKGPASGDRMTTEVAIIVAKYIRKYYLTFESPELSVVIDGIHAEISRQNRQELTNHVEPSESTIRRWKRNNVTDYEEVWFREGAEVAQQKFRNVKIAPRATRPLERVQIDHTKVDIQLVVGTRKDGKGRDVPVVKRPWLTLATCEATRMTYGFYLSFDHPSWTSVMNCLRMAVMPKDELVARANCQSEWPLYGVPEVVIMDNGKEFHSKSLKAAAGHLGFEALNVPRRKGHLKGQVERRNGEVARDFLAFLPGRTFANIKERGDYPSEKKASLTLADLTKAFTFWTVDIVHNRGHRALMMQTPLGRLDEIKGAGVKLPGDPKELDALIGLTIERTIQSKGIEHLGVWYKKPGLNTLKKRPGHLGKLWMVKIDPLNANEILLLDEQAGKWVKIPSSDPELTEGLTLADWRKVVAQARGRAKVSQAISRQALLAARLRLLEAGYEFGAGKVKPISKEDLDWVNSYQRQDGPKVLVEGGEQSPIDATRNKNRKKPAPSKGKVSANEGTPLPELDLERIENAPSIQTDIYEDEDIYSDEIEEAIKEQRSAQSVLPDGQSTAEQQQKLQDQFEDSTSDEVYDPDDPENWS